MSSIQAGWPPKVARIKRVGNQEAQIRSIILKLRIRIRGDETESVRETTNSAELQSIVLRLAFIARDADRSKAFVGTKYVLIHARIRLKRPWGELINVALPLQMQTAPPHIGDLHNRVEAEIALEVQIPGPGFGIL